METWRSSQQKTVWSTCNVFHNPLDWNLVDLEVCYRWFPRYFPFCNIFNLIQYLSAALYHSDEVKVLKISNRKMSQYKVTEQYQKGPSDFKHSYLLMPAWHENLFSNQFCLCIFIDFNFVILNQTVTSSVFRSNNRLLSGDVFSSHLLKLGFLAMVNIQPLHQQWSKTRTSSTTKAVEDEESA